MVNSLRYAFLIMPHLHHVLSTTNENWLHYNSVIALKTKNLQEKICDTQRRRTSNIHIPSRHLKIFLYYMIKSRCTNQGIHFTPSLHLQLINYCLLTVNHHVKHLLAYTGRAYPYPALYLFSFRTRDNQKQDKRLWNIVLTAKGRNKIKMIKNIV